MTKANPKVTLELTENELRYLLNLTGFPSTRFPQLRAKMVVADKDMRAAKRIANRERKASRGATPQHITLDEVTEPYDGIMWGDND